MGLAGSAILLAGSLALSYYAQNRAKRRAEDEFKAKTRDNTPTDTATRGGIPQFFQGRRVIPPMQAWVGERTSFKTSKWPGAGGNDLIIYRERAWHVLCQQECDILHRILADNKVIFEGPIEKSAFPSGSTLQITPNPKKKVTQSFFRIFWGEDDQPINTSLGDASRVGIDSRWPGYCYIEWTQYTMGPQVRWERITYDMERYPLSGLTQSPIAFPTSFSELTEIQDDVIYAIAGADVPGGTYTDEFGQQHPAFAVDGNRTDDYKIGRKLRLTGNQLIPGGLYEIVFATYFDTESFEPSIFPDGSFNPIFIDQAPTGTYIALLEINSAQVFSPTGFVNPTKPNADGGANGAHCLYELFFTSNGANLVGGSFGGLWDFQSLEEVGIQLNSEILKTNVIGTNGASAQALAAEIMQDLGIILFWDFSLNPAKYRFKLLRFSQEEDVINIPQEAILNYPPQFEHDTGIKKTNQMVFEYVDATFSGRQRTVKVSDDGSVSLTNDRPDYNKVFLPTVTDYDTAVKVSTRRSLEDLPNTGVLKLEMARDSMKIPPGSSVRIPEYPFKLRVADVKPSFSTGRNTIECLRDTYTVPIENYFPDGTVPGTEGKLGNEADLAFTILEMPKQLNFSNSVVFVPLRIRDNALVGTSAIFISDNLTNNPFPPFGLLGSWFTAQNLQNVGFVSGGTLVEDWNTDKTWEETGGLISALGPDISDVPSLAGDFSSWTKGTVWAYVNGEIIFLRNLSIEGENYRLQGCIRGRYATEIPVVNHPAGSVVYIFRSDDVQKFIHPYFSPSANVTEDGLSLTPKVYWFSSIPNHPSPLSYNDAGIYQHFIIGRGVLPLTPGCLRPRDQQFAVRWDSGWPLRIDWNYQSVYPSTYYKTGAGELNTDDTVIPITLPEADPEVDFEIKVSGDIEGQGFVTNIRVVTIKNANKPTWKYKRAKYRADFVSPLPNRNILIQVAAIKGGYRSENIAALFLKEVD